MLAKGSAASPTAGCSSGSGFRYQRREPEKTPLYRIVREHLASFIAEAAERYPSGDLPTFVRREFERYLRCGLLCHGFARLRCITCSDELLVAFSCKNRGVCPSCAARRMADTAAHLRDHVLPAVPMRQWVLTLPKRLRFLLAWRPTLISLTLKLFLRVLFAWQRRCARRQGVKNPLCGAVTCIQRFGSSLNLNLHFHTLVPDGVFFEDAHGVVQFHPLAPPMVAELDKLLRKLLPRLLRKLAVELENPEPSDWMQLLADALQTSTSGPPRSDPPRGLCVLMEGFSLHAGVAVDKADRDTLERLARYCARPPLALRRLSLAPDGQVLYRVKHAAPGGPRVLRLSPTQFLGKLAALVPPPRAHLVRFHGVFGPNSQHRARLVPKAPPLLAPRNSAPPHDPSRADTPPPPKPVGCGHRLDWASLLHRVFAIDVLHCEHCGGRRQLVALLTQADVAPKALARLGLPTQAPAPSPARAPPPAAESIGWRDQDAIDPIPPSWYD